MKNKKAAIGFIFVTLLLDVIGFGIIIPMMPKLIATLINGSIGDAALYGGWIMFSFSIMQFLFAPIMGNLSDQFGRRRVLLIALFGFGINYIIMAFAPSIMWLFIGRILAGATGASTTTASAYIADVSEPEKRAQNFGIIGAAFGLGFIIGPVMGGVLGQFGERVPFYAAAIITFLNWIYGYFILPESLAKENRRKFDWKRANPFGSLAALKKYPLVAGLIEALVAIYIAAFAVQTTWTYINMEKFHWNQAMIGYSLGFVGLMVAIVQGGLIRYTTPKLGQKNSVYFGLILYALGFVLFAFASQTWMMFAFSIIYCLGGIAGPAIQGLISNQVPANEQGELQGALTSLMSASAIVGPPIMTNIFHYFTSEDTPIYFPGAPYLLGFVLILLSLFFTMRSLKIHFAKKD